MSATSERGVACGFLECVRACIFWECGRKTGGLAAEWEGCTSHVWYAKLAGQAYVCDLPLPQPVPAPLHAHPQLHNQHLTTPHTAPLQRPCLRSKDDGRGRLLWGRPPPPAVQFTENGISFACDVVEGQKSGFFLDQRENRARMQPLARGRRVLNLFGYTGGFSVYAGGWEQQVVGSRQPRAMRAGSVTPM